MDRRCGAAKARVIFHSGPSVIYALIAFAIVGVEMGAAIVIVDYGVGNVGALLNMFDFIGVEAATSGKPEEIAAASGLVLPGVGAFDRAMRMLRDRGLIPVLEHAALRRRIPVLGVCLGMQLLARRSEEGVESGLGWMNADVLKLNTDSGKGHRVPHIGWAEVSARPGAELFAKSAVSPRFYFDHSYYVMCDDPEEVSATFDFGIAVCCAIQRSNIFGVQFHPEKSHRHGMKLLEAFGSMVISR